MKGKTLKMLGMLSLLAIIIFSACHKDDITSTPNATDVELKSLISEYESVELDLETIKSQLINGQSEKSLVLIPGKYEFKLQNTSPQTPIEIIDEEAGTTESIDMTNTQFDNNYLGDPNHTANFTLIDNEFSGNFSLNTENYYVVPASHYIPGAPESQYIIYKDGAIREEIYTPAMALAALNDIEQLGDVVENGEEFENVSAKTTKSFRLLKVNVYTDHDFRKAIGWGSTNKQKCLAYITNTLNEAQKKYKYAKLPITFKLNRVYHLPTSQIRRNTTTLNDQYNAMKSHLRKKPWKLSDINILFTKSRQQYPLAISTMKAFWKINQHKRMHLIGMNYNSNVAQRDNLTAHEIAHLFGAGHRRNGAYNGAPPYGRNVMNGRAPTMKTQFHQATINEIRGYISSGKFQTSLF